MVVVVGEALPGYWECESADPYHEGQHRSIWHLHENEKGTRLEQWGLQMDSKVGG